MLNTTTPGKSNARATFERLAAAGVLGFITRFEATEVIAFPPHGKPPINVFSIFVAEEADGSLPPLQYLSKDGPISLAALNDWKFGIVRYHVTTEALDTELEALATDTRWQPSGKSLDTGPMREVPVQFVPSDSFQPVPWNRVLKNNFHGGAHVMEWACTDFARLKILLAESKRIRQLAEAVRKVVPIDLDGFSDRIGSIVVQLPVTIALVAIARAQEGGLVGELAWHPRATPRPLRISCEFLFDRVVTGYASTEATSGTFSLPARSDRGTHRLFVWDDANCVLLAASGESVFSNTIVLNMHPMSPEPRVFSMRNGSSARSQQRIRVVAQSLTSIIGSSESDDTAGATRRRLYLEETERLSTERRFVQYRPPSGRESEERAKALDDLRKLINWHGQDAMSVGDSLRRLIDASASAAPEAPALLLEHIGAQVDPLSILAGYDPFHRAGELLEEDFPGLRHLAARRTTRSDGQITGLLRWLVDGLKDWKRGNDPGHVQLVSLLSVVLLLGNCRKVWDAIPDDVGANSELIAALEAAVLSSHVTISPRQNAPIWEGEAITVLTRADSEQDWPEIADRWRSFESAIIGEPFLLVAACGLARFRFDRLVTAVHSHAQTVDCMRLAGALMVGERLSLALATANEHVRFCCVYSAMRDCPRQSSLRPEEQEALTNVLVVVSNDLPNWKKWMQVFARYSVRYGALQAPLGTALARVQDGALKYYVDAIELNIGGAVGRDAVAACFTAFRDESNVGRRTRLWQLAYERWLEWNFGASSADSLVSGISRSELDFAVVGHIVETTSQTDRSRTIKELTRDLAAIETAWHVSHTDMITAWYRILSKIQPFAHADYVVSSGGNWLSTTTVQLPYSPDDPYPRLKYGHFDRRQ